MNDDDGEGRVDCSPGPLQREDGEVEEEDRGLCECQREDVEYEREPEALFFCFFKTGRKGELVFPPSLNGKLPRDLPSTLGSDVFLCIDQCRRYVAPCRV